MDTFTAIDFETGFASTFRFWPKPLSYRAVTFG